MQESYFEDAQPSGAVLHDNLVSLSSCPCRSSWSCFCFWKLSVLWYKTCALQIMFRILLDTGTKKGMVRQFMVYGFRVSHTWWACVFESLFMDKLEHTVSKYFTWDEHAFWQKYGCREDDKASIWYSILKKRVRLMRFYLFLNQSFLHIWWRQSNFDMFYSQTCLFRVNQRVCMCTIHLRKPNLDENRYLCIANNKKI